MRADYAFLFLMLARMFAVTSAFGFAPCGRQWWSENNHFHFEVTSAACSILCKSYLRLRMGISPKCNASQIGRANSAIAMR